MRPSSWALAVAIIGGSAACESRVDEARAQRRSSVGVPTVDADRRPKMSTSPHTGAPERSDASIEAGARDRDRDNDSPDAGHVATVAVGDRDEVLLGEAPERDPRSDVVKVKVIVDARRQAHVIWGRKDFGLAPLEIQRPRNSGPLDLVVVAPGYLPHHARAVTDRDDVIMLHLTAVADAPQLLGYRSSEVPRVPTKYLPPNPLQSPSPNPLKKAPKEASGETPKKK